LKEIGIPAVYIRDDNIGNVEYDEVISEQTRQEALKVTKDVMDSIRLSSDFDLQKVNKIVDELISELLVSKDLLVALVDMRAANDTSFYHGVNTTVLSVITGIALGYDIKKLGQLACGALFHDIGIIMLPPELLKRQAPLSAEENEKIMKHPELGFEILRKKEGVSLMSAHVALQHHEKYDGTGYPRGLAGDEISEFSRIVAITAIYDDLASVGFETSRLLPHQAVEYLTIHSGKWFDPEILQVFFGTIAVFPLGTLVLLNSGETALVTKVNKKFPTRPVVRVFKNRNGAKVYPPFEIDLAKNPAYFVQKVLANDEP
jgi:HD-GYP domain-containing protein (c-di-GMP phosphodiesterase class II)